MRKNHAFFQDGQKTVRVFASAAERENRNDEIYDARRHAGKIFDGDLKMHFVKAAAAKEGDKKPANRAHFRVTSKRQNETQENKKAVSTYDDEIGMRLHVNTGSYSSLQPQNENPELKKMRPKSLHTAADFLSTMMEIGPERWKKSVVVHKEHNIPTNEFVVRYGREDKTHKRMTHLVERLLNTQGPLPCLLEVQLEKAVLPPNYKDMHVKSMEVEWGKENGKKRKIVPEITIPYRFEDSSSLVDTVTRLSFSDPGKYLVLGYVELERNELDRVIYYNLKMDVRHGEQVAHVDIDKEFTPAVEKKGTAMAPQIAP